MDFLNMVEKIRDSTAMDSRGFSTLQRIPRRERLYLRLLLVTDFVSGMSDSYAKDLYQKLNGIS